MTTKIAEKLTILGEVGKGLMVRLYNVRTKYLPENKNRPTLVSDQQYAKVLAALMKKFPEVPADLEKTPGYDIMMSKSKQIYDELEADYDTFCDTLNWITTSLTAMTDITNAIACLALPDNPMLTVAFLDLMLMYCQVNILWSMIVDRRTIAIAFSRIFYTVKCQNESNFQKVAQYFINCADPYKKIREDFRPLYKRIGQALLSLGPAYIKINNLQILRKEGTLNITLNPDKLPLPSQDLMQLDLLLRDRMYAWITFGYLFCTDELASKGAFDLVRVVLHQGFRAPIFRNLSIPIHNFYEQQWKTFKSKTLKIGGKEKKILTEGLQASVTGQGITDHRSARIYLRQSLRNLLGLFRDFPGLLGPKMILLWSGLNAAKTEVLWYFRHISAPIPKTKDKFTEDTIRDPHISELIYLIDQLSSLIRQHQRIIQAYYLEYLHGADYLSLKEQLTAVSSNTTAAQLVKGILAELSGINVDGFMNGQESNFEALRLNWFRVEAQLSQTSSTVTASSVKELIHRGRLIVLHSKNVDMLEELIDQYASLKGLWYYRDHLLSAFDKSILEGPSNPLHCMSFLHLLGEFPENATSFFPQERQDIGPYCVKLAEDMLNKITHRVASVLFELGKYSLNFHNQLNHVNAAHPLLQRMKDYKPDKNYVPPTTPGAESQYKNRKELDNLRLYERNVHQLCYAMESTPEIVVYDHQFIPREFLREKLLEVLRRFVKKSVICDDQNHLIQRPSVLETRFQLFFSTVRLLENYIDIDVGEALREFLLTHVYNKALSEVNKIEWTVEGEISWPTDTMIKLVSKWYGEFVSKRLAIPGICYSPNRRAFISRAAMQFRAEEYSDLCELQALVRLIGPYGVKCIDREIMKYIASNITALRELLTLNRKTLGEISVSYYKDVAPQLKALRDVDMFIGRSISIGNALQFRQLLHDAQRLVAEQDIPYICNSVSIAFNQYPRNTFMKPEFLEMDALAHSIGIEPGTADQSLKAVLSKLIGEQDKDLWYLLPFMYAAAFVSSKTWGEAIYRSAVEAYANNAHTLSLCINALLISIKATTSVSEAEREIVDLLKKFVESSACILLRHAQLPQKSLEKVGIQSLPSIIIFMDKFVQDSPLLTHDMLESCLPYSMLRSLYRQLYESKAGKKKGGETQEDAL